MKKILLLVIVVTLVSNAINAQVMAAKPQWITIKSANLHCWECKERLESYLLIENKSNMESGMIKWSFNLINGEVKIQYLPDRVSLDDIRTAINNAGFDADTTKAEPSVYAKLPPSCKRIEDGGGPKKGAPCHLDPRN